ncbi:hypothetical protein MXD59_19065 [Frankia sp. Ag45/Mut15]|uniref:RNA polymerase alpha subunit C-terminal domain-containing protein n=1 Tax=Frankia umida TaxID=573489 RepID=A0ABT0K2B1_9ACTN|nr:hypothetical protein [Frankia umida]MCK9877851.1 hypothetical protein [Frankia umida]
MRLLHQTPIGAYPELEAGGSALEALATVVPRFLAPKRRSSYVFARGGADVTGVDVLLFGLPEAGEVHVVGRSWLAQQMRDLLQADRAPGWHLHELPESTTSMYALFPHLPAVAINVLEKYPFTTVEELIAAPDRGLMDLRRLGTKSVAAIRAACQLPAVKEFRSDPRRSAGSTIGPYADRVGLAHRIRYRPFLERLAQIPMPAAAIDQILESINAELLPPADPRVISLLEAAGADDLGVYYRRTHQLTLPG